MTAPRRSDTDPGWINRRFKELERSRREQTAAAAAVSRGLTGRVATLEKAGVQGPQGFQGAAGSPGAQGFQGAQGATGAQGNQGVRGFQGFQGFQGSQGFQGTQGATGAGTQGAQGVQGRITGLHFTQVSTGPGSPASQGEIRYNPSVRIDVNELTVEGVDISALLASSVGMGYYVHNNAGVFAEGVVTAATDQGSWWRLTITEYAGDPTYFAAFSDVYILFTPRGAQGAQGAQGNQGFQGFQGTTGAQGNQGFQGFQGSTGAQGTQGHQGTQGNQGFQGDQGAVGIRGVKGDQGEQGDQGFQGDQGNQGNQGFQGATGSTGAQGNQGFQGTQGTTGAQGAQGNQGLTGAQGVTGATGTQGNQGFQGTQGYQGYQGQTGHAAGVPWQFDNSTSMANPGSGKFRFDAGQTALAISVNDLSATDRTAWLTGLTGNTITLTDDNGIVYEAVVTAYANNTTWVQLTISVQAATGTFTNASHVHLLSTRQGAQGFQGTQGFQGVQGTQGFQGTQGATGATGSTGAQGNQGFQGTQGTTGATGSTGPQGNQGFQGTQGATGGTGSTGSQGNQGFQGTQGTTGATGSTGPQGNQGFQGFQGPQGNQGFQGVQGFQGQTGHAAGVPWQFDNSTSMANPGSGKFRFDAGGSNIAISVNDLSATDRTAWLTGLTGNTITLTDDNGLVWEAVVTAYANNTTWVQLTISVQAATGTFTNASHVHLLSVRQGSQGTQGFQGNQGVQGSTGSQGTQGFQGTTGSIGSQGNQGFQGTQGAQGNQGFQGTQGNQGFQGLTGAAPGIPWTFQGTSTAADPGTGNLYAKSDFTQLYISETDQGGTNEAAFLGLLTTNAVLYFSGGPGVYTVYKVTGAPTDNGTWWTIPVLFLGSAGSFSGGPVLRLIPSVTGAQGAQGFQGPQGFQGSQGSQGNQGTQGFQGNQGNQGFQGTQGATATVNTAVQALASANTSVTSTNSAAPNDITGCTTTISVGSTAEIYEVSVDVTGLFTAAADVILLLNVNGSVVSGADIFSAAAGRYGHGGRHWTVTGLAAGNRVFKAQAYLSVATTVTMAQTHCVITVRRVS